MADREASAQLVACDDVELQEELPAQLDSGRGRSRMAAQVCAAAACLAAAVAGSVRLLGGGHATAVEVSESIEYVATHLNSSKCHWIKMEHHDFPDRGDVQTVEYTDFSDLAEIEKYAEDHGFVGFALYKNTAFLKGGDNAPRSWKDMLWMGPYSPIDFYLCEDKNDYKQTQEQVNKALAVLNGYIEDNTKPVEGQWMTVHGSPKIEGETMHFDNQQEANTVDDMKILCAAHPDCVGFKYNKFAKGFHARKKDTGFVADTAQYYQEMKSQWHLAGPGESCVDACRVIGKACRPSLFQKHNREIDNSTKLADLLQSFHESCSTFRHKQGHNPDVPNKDPVTGECFISSSTRNLSSYSCGTRPDLKRKRRLCMCDDGSWEWYYITSRAQSFGEARSGSLSNPDSQAPLGLAKVMVKK